MDTPKAHEISGLRLHDFFTVQIFSFQEGYETLDAAGNAHNFLYVRRFSNGRWEGFAEPENLREAPVWRALGTAEENYLEKQWELFKPKMV